MTRYSEAVLVGVGFVLLAFPGCMDDADINLSVDNRDEEEIVIKVEASYFGETCPLTPGPIRPCPESEGKGVLWYSREFRIGPNSSAGEEHWSPEGGTHELVVTGYKGAGPNATATFGGREFLDLGGGIHSLSIRVNNRHVSFSVGYY